MMSVPDLVTIGDKLVNFFKMDMHKRRKRSSLLCVSQAMLSEVDFSEKPSSQLFLIAVELVVACLAKLKTLDLKNLTLSFNRSRSNSLDKTEKTKKLADIVAVTRKKNEELCE